MGETAALRTGSGIFMYRLDLRCSQRYFEQYYFLGCNTAQSDMALTFQRNSQPSYWGPGSQSNRKQRKELLIIILMLPRESIVTQYADSAQHGTNSVDVSPDNNGLSVVSYRHFHEKCLFRRTSLKSVFWMFHHRVLTLDCEHAESELKAINMPWTRTDVWRLFHGNYTLWSMNKGDSFGWITKSDSGAN